MGIGTATPNELLSLRSTAPSISMTDTTASNAVALIDANDGRLRIKTDTGNVMSGSYINFHIDGAE